MDRNGSKGTPTQTIDVARDNTLEAASDPRPEARLHADQRGNHGTPMNAADIKGRAVISVATGARLGRVEDVLLDPTAPAIAAFRVSADGQEALIPFAQVQSLGSDAVMVPGDDVAQWATTSSAAEGLVSFNALKHFKVVDEAGTFLGTPKSLALEPGDGRLRQLDVHKGGVLGMGGETTTIPGGGIASVGADVIVVRTAAPAP